MTRLGVCYYPEHWPEETWVPDAERMKALGLHWVRIGEFAWGRIEPTPGTLDFGWLDRAVDTLGDAGLKVILGTPTPTPPKWLIDRYDDILQVDQQGHIRGFGSRRHYCFNAPNYRAETERIVTALAERYGQHDAVGAWQTDNEYGCHDTVRCYCDNCKSAFRLWLRERYGSVDALNEAWWNVFWSMEYRDFDEVELPNLTVTEPNPSHSLDFYRFSSDSVVDYNRVHTNILREHAPGRLLVHNSMFFFGDYDHFKLTEDLDVITWDSYPLGMLEQSPLPADVKTHYLRVGHPDLISFNHDVYYGLKQKPFWVMEQQPGQVNWADSNPLPEPGAVRLWSHQAFAHGADVVSYFRWRAAVGAQELMHAGLNKHGGSPDRATDEAAQVAHEKPDVLPESSAEVALLLDYENLWATSLQPHAQGWSYWSLLVSYYQAARQLGLNVAITHPRRDLSRYKLVLAPALHLVDDSLANHLQSYVEQSGTLVVGPRSGFKTLSNTVQAPAPGPLAELMGVIIEHVDALRPGVNEEISYANTRYPYTTWADLLTPTTAETLATYETRAYRGTAAVTRNRVGDGTCLTVGMWSDSKTLGTLLRAELEPLSLIDLPEGVRLTTRGDVRYYVNFNPHDVTVEGVTISAYGVVIAP